MTAATTSTVADDVCAEIGYTATCALLAWHGGRTLYVPQHLDRAGRPHPLARVIGEPALRALVRAWGGETLRLPEPTLQARMVRDRLIAERFAEGVTPARVAAELGLTERRAQQLRAELAERGWLAYAGPTPIAGPPG